MPESEHPDIKVVREASSELPEQLRPAEYGEKVTRPVPLGLLIRLSQTREGINPALSELKSSIARVGMINQPDIARVQRDELSTYIEFVNSTWGSKWCIDDLPCDDDGLYHLVIAGHSRIEAIEQLEQERQQEALSKGFETDFRNAVIVCKIVDALSPDEIIAYQLDENIHKEPAQERVAIALVETYLFGFRSGQWQNKAEFLRKAGNHFSRRRLDDALAFADLPSEIRDFALSGAIKYGVVVEVARAAQAYKEYATFRYLRHLAGTIDDAELVAQLNEHVTEWAGHEIAVLLRNKTNATIARQRYKYEMSSWNDTITRIQREEKILAGESIEGVQPAMFAENYDLSGPERDWLRTRKKLRDKYLALIRELADQPFRDAERCLRLHAQSAHLSDDERQTLFNVTRSGVEHYARSAGKVALHTLPSDAVTTLLNLL